MKINTHLSKLKKNIDKNIKLSKKNIYFSIGENCLSDNILSRYNIKSFSSPYSSGRSNIEYILYYEKERFISLLDDKCLKKELINNSSIVVRNKRLNLKNMYHESCMNGFEFTHHNVLDDSKARKAIQRRCKRLLSLKNKKIVMLYHHRMCETTDNDLLLQHLLELSSIYEQRNNNVKIYCFTQTLVDNPQQRKVVVKSHDNIIFYKFYTIKEWAGDDQTVFWGKCDEDLIQSMIKDISTELI